MATVKKNKKTIMSKLTEVILYFITTICVMLAPIKGLVWVVLLFVSIDTIMALYQTIKINGIKSLRSHKFFNIVPKVLFYIGSIIALFLTDVHIFDGSIWGIEHLLSKTISLVWIYIEIKSIDEISMKLGNRSLWVHLKNLMNKLKAFKKDIQEIGDTGKGNYLDGENKGK